MKIELEYGRTGIVLDVPEKKIISSLNGNPVPCLDQSIVEDRIRDGVTQHLPRNVSRHRVAVIVPDNTRLWARGDLYVPVIVNALLDAGVAKSSICIIIALGTHAPMAREDFPALVGQWCAQHITVLNSANQDNDRLVPVGTTDLGTKVLITKEAVDADHIIIFGGILHHLIAGFGGGRKYILPGIAGYDSIRANHALAFRENGLAHPGVRQGELAGNPVHQDLEQAAALFLKSKTCTYAAVAANGQGHIFYAGAGPLAATFLQGCQALNQACCVSIKDKADFALISAGGFRTDGQLYQSTKALFNAVHAVKEGGCILFAARAFEGVGNPEFGTALSRFNGRSADLGAVLAKDFSMPGYVAFRVADLLERFSITLVSDFSEDQTKQFGFRYARDLDEYVNNLEGKGFVIPYAENILPLPQGAQ